VRSQRERDLDAIALARRKGVMLAQLGQLATDDRLDPASLPVVEWFRDQVEDAAGDRRLDDLAGLLPEAGIQRRRWWQQPAAITGAAYDDDDDMYDDGGQACDGLPGRPAAVIDYAAELAARSWIFEPHGAGICQLVHLKPHGWDWLPPESCLHRAAHAIPGGVVCGSCYYALSTPLVRRPA
jgi:hypothetical protein